MKVPSSSPSFPRTAQARHVTAVRPRRDVCRRRLGCRTRTEPRAPGHDGARHRRADDAAVRFDIPAGMMRDVVRRFTEADGREGDDGERSARRPAIARRLGHDDGTAGARPVVERHRRGATSSRRQMPSRSRSSRSRSSSPWPGSVPRNAQSPKYGDEVRDTPQAIVVIPQQVFEEQSATSLREVLRNTPGITMSIGEGASGTVSFGDNMLIRGFNARNDIYIDGARDPGEISPRHVQRRSGGSGEGPDVGHRRPRLDGRLDQHGQQGRRRSPTRPAAA